MTVLYNCILKHDPGGPKWPDRDRFILSAGHKVMGLYVTLADQKYFDEEILWTYSRNYTLNLNKTTSPSFTIYSLPSIFTMPFSFAVLNDPSAISFSQGTISARIKPLSKSVWILPAALGALSPFFIVQARTS
ncbi:MAG TPA: hypothetical protein DCP02_05115 [Actinobacteria bacterium]|nr:hypothetical protein [Actinomycetota bacterium]